MKSFQQYTQPKLDELNLPKYDSKITIVEAADPFNIAIVKDKDFDLLPNTPKADLGQLKSILKQLSYVNSVPMAGQPSGKKFRSLF